MRWMFVLGLSFMYSVMCAQSTKAIVIAKEGWLDSLLQSNQALKAAYAHQKDWNVQIIYSIIDRDTNNVPHFTDHVFNIKDQQYFYPASTVKMPLAFLALEKLHRLNRAGLDKNSIMITDSSAAQQKIIYTDPTSENSVPSIAHYIKQIFLVSDNQAYNRLYEFLGQAYIQQQLKKKGFNDAVIRHRFQFGLSTEQNRQTNAISFFDTSGNLLYEQKAQNSKAKFPEKKVLLGKGYIDNHDQLVAKPFDFTFKNRVSLASLHQMLRAMLFPESVAPQQRFDLSEADERFLLRYMSGYPKETNYPYYDRKLYWDAYAKFLLWGNKKDSLTNSPIRIFNKVGNAYGFLTDIAYIIDTEKNIEFMLSATIACNTDGVFNDDQYDYDTIGYPFMEALGKSIYQYELTRKRAFMPNLTKFKLDYTQY